MTYDHISRKITLDDGTTEVTSLFWASLSDTPITLRLYNTSSVNTTANLVGAVRGDLLESTVAITDESEATANGMGKELCNETWLEVRAGITGTWYPVDSWSNMHDIGAINAGSYQTFQVRINAPSTYDSKGMIAFALRFSTPI